jgi:uncharacterized protein YjiK
MNKKLIPFLLLLIMAGCDRKDTMVSATGKDILQPISVFDMEVKEPSGLSFGESNQSLWTVSDPPDNKVYEIDLQGYILQTLSFTGDDLEGVAYDSLDQAIWIIEERKGEIVKLDIQGTELERHPVYMDITNTNNGLEGIAITVSKQFWVVNQNQPCELIELNSDFSIHNHFSFSFIGDLNGLCHDVVDGQFWMVSSTNRLLIHWNQSEGIMEQYNLPMRTPEGIAIDFNNNLAYIVSDSEAKLYVFQLKLDN